MNDMQFTKPNVDIWVLVNIELEVQRVADANYNPSSLKNGEANPTWLIQHGGTCTAFVPFFGGREIEEGQPATSALLK